MKRGRFSEEQIVGICKEHEAGRMIAELAREHGVSEAAPGPLAESRLSLPVGIENRRSARTSNRVLRPFAARKDGYVSDGQSGF